MKGWVEFHNENLKGFLKMSLCKVNFSCINSKRKVKISVFSHLQGKSKKYQWRGKIRFNTVGSGFQILNYTSIYPSSSSNTSGHSFFPCRELEISKGEEIVSFWAKIGVTLEALRDWNFFLCILHRSCAPRRRHCAPDRVLRLCPTRPQKLPLVLCPWPWRCALGQGGPPSKTTTQYASNFFQTSSKVLQDIDDW